MANNLDTEEIREILGTLVKEGRVTASCSACKRPLTPEDHDKNACPSCGVFAGAREPLYFPPN